MTSNSMTPGTMQIRLIRTDEEKSHRGDLRNILSTVCLGKFEMQ